MSNKYVIWGCGVRGKRCLTFLGQDKVIAYIDKNEELQGQYYNDIPIISFDDYQMSYKEYIVIVSPEESEDIVKLLEKNNIYQYLLLEDCPAEMRGLVYYDIINNFPFPLNEKVVLYGIGLYSLLLGEKVYREKEKRIDIVVQQSMSIERQQAILERALYITTISEQAIAEGSIVYCTINGGAVYLANLCKDKKINVIDAYDLSFEIPYYYNPKIEKFRKIHNRKRIFIVCTGPSLKVEDLNRLHKYNEVCISMNGIFHVYSKTAWRSKYYVCMDYKCLNAYFDEILELEADAKFISEHSMEFWEQLYKDDNIYKIHTCLVDLKNNDVRFSEECSRVVYDTYTVTYACIQLAVYMGAKEVVLLGCDFNYDIQKTEDGFSNHFCVAYNSAIEEKITTNLSGQYAGYVKAKEYADANNIKIYNATRGGKLEVFERVDFDSLF